MLKQKRVFALIPALLFASLLTSCGSGSAFDSPEDELAFNKLQQDFEYRPLDFLDEAHVWMGKKGFEELDSQIPQALESELGPLYFKDPERIIQILETYEGRVEWQGFSTAKSNAQSVLADKSVAEQVSELVDNGSFGNCENTFSDASSLIEKHSWKSSWEQEARSELIVTGKICTEFWADYFLEQQVQGNDLFTITWLNLFAEWDPDGASEFVKTYSENLD